MTTTWKYIRSASLPLLLVALFCEAGWLVSLAPTDLTHYECYGLTFWLGSHGTSLVPQAQCLFLKITTPSPAFHMLPLEYPPLTILIFSLPLLAPLAYYPLFFALLMSLAIAGVYWLLLRSDAPLSAPIFLLYLGLGTIAVVQERFDLLPALCTLICLLAAERRAWRTAYIALALGVLLKLYPLVLFPALFLAEQQAWRENSPAKAHPIGWFLASWRSRGGWRWLNSLLFFGLLLVVTAAFALFNVYDALISPLVYFVQRPPQIESLASSVLWLGGSFGWPYQIVFSFGSLNLSGALVGLISPLDTLLTLAGLLWLLVLQGQKRLSLAQTLVGLICVLMVTGKVFSPQYLIWLFPLLAYTFVRGGTNRFWMSAWALISVLTTFIYVFYYSRLPDPDTASQILPTLAGFFELVALRNLLLLISVLAFLSNWWGTRQPKASAVA